MTIFWSAISAILVFYFRECLKLANEQQEIAARLEAYLHHWSKKLIEGSDGVYKLTSIGYRWAEKYRECKTGQEIIAVDEEMNSKLSEMKEELRKNKALVEYLDEIKAQINQLPGGIDVAYEMMREYRRDIIDGKTFPPDSELAKLGAKPSKMAVSMKLNMASLVEDTMLFIKKIESSTDYENDHKMVWNLYIDWLKLNRDKQLIMQYTEKQLSKGSFNLALSNFFSGL